MFCFALAFLGVRTRPRVAFAPTPALIQSKRIECLIDVFEVDVE